MRTLLFLLLLLPSLSLAQTPYVLPAADAASPEALLHALYDVISGPAGPRNWDRFRALCKPDARFIAHVRRPGMDSLRHLSMTVGDYITQAGTYFDTHAFWEEETGHEMQRFGEIVHVFSAYESFDSLGGTPIDAGVNSIQMVWENGRWWVVTVLWESTAPPSLMIPKKLRRRK